MGLTEVFFVHNYLTGNTNVSYLVSNRYQMLKSKIVSTVGLFNFLLSSLLFHAGQAAIKLPSAEASKRAQCTSPGQYAPYIKGIMKTP